MKIQFAWTLLAACTPLCTLSGQNTGARATPQTQGATPSGISPDTTAAQGGAVHNGASHGTRRRTQAIGPSGSVNRSDADGGSQGQPGITGVPAYDPGSGREAGTPAPAATERVTVIGDANADGIHDRGRNSLEDGAPLPGVTLRHNTLGIPAGTPIAVKLLETLDSGHVKNGQMVNGMLAASLGKIPAGAPVQLTVVAVAKAGEISSRGELSLQVVTVNGEPALSEVVTAEGKEGTKILPDDAPARGTEAQFTADQTITLPAS